jgi:hypothetical protein
VGGVKDIVFGGVKEIFLSAGVKYADVVERKGE